jgi:TPR repeat protein
MGAFLLSRLHAKGAGVAFSPALSDHYARVAVPVWSAADYRDGLAGPDMAAGEFPTDGIVTQQLAEAEAWLTRHQALAEPRLHQVVRRYRSGERSPVSSLLAESLYESLVPRVLAGTGGGEILVEYLRYEVDKFQIAPGIVPRNVAWLQMVAYEAAADRASPDAQAMLGEFFLSGTLFPQSDLLAFAWFHAAKNTGATVSVSLSNIRDRLSHREVQGVSRFLKLGLLPNFVFEDTHIQNFRSLIAR